MSFLNALGIVRPVLIADGAYRNRVLRPIYTEELPGVAAHDSLQKLWQAGLHGFHLRWDLNEPWPLEGRAICCFAYFLLSLLFIGLAFVVEICMGLTQSCYVTEDFGMVVLPLLRLLYGPWPVATIRRPTTWLCQGVLASTLAYTTYTSCNPLDQGWTNSGPRAECGPPQRFQWPAEALRKYVQIWNFFQLITVDASAEINLTETCLYFH